MSKVNQVRHVNVLAALGLQSLVAICLFLISAWRNHNNDYWYLVWNLFLSWLPLFFAYTLVRYLKKYPWLSWEGLLLTVLWLGFLPNSFYMLSDFIHLGSTTRVDIVFDVVMFASFAISGLTLGFISLYLVHRQLIKRLKPTRAHVIVGLTLLLCGFAIYLGRNLRWNTWDVLINPAGVLFSVSDPLLNPVSHPEAFSTTFGFFVLLASIYTVIWQFIRSLQNRQDS